MDPDGVFADTQDNKIWLTKYDRTYEVGDDLCMELTLADSDNNIFLYWYIKDDDGGETPIFTVPEGTYGELTLYPKVISKTITTDGQLTALATRYQYERLRSDEATTLTLGADIELPQNWTAIGSADIPFLGTFDGNGRTITMPGGSKAQPLFYALGSSGSVGYGAVKNLIVDLNNVTMDPIAFGDYYDWGAIAGTSYSKITNCRVYGTANYDGSGQTVRFGGLTGQSGSEKINCTGITNCQAGTAGEPLTLNCQKVAAANSMVGGLVGANYIAFSIDDTASSSYDPKHNVELNTAAAYAGGLIGFASTGATKYVTIKNSQITARIQRNYDENADWGDAVGYTENGSGGLIGKFTCSPNVSGIWGGVTCTGTTVNCTLIDDERLTHSSVGGFAGTMIGGSNFTIECGTDTLSGSISAGHSESVGKFVGCVSKTVTVKVIDTELLAGISGVDGWDFTGLEGDVTSCVGIKK